MSPCHSLYSCTFYLKYTHHYLSNSYYCLNEPFYLLEGLFLCLLNLFGFTKSQLKKELTYDVLGLKKSYRHLYMFVSNEFIFDL